MNDSNLRISYKYVDIWACKITLRDALEYLEMLQKFFSNKSEISPSDRAWLFASLQCHIHCLAQEVDEMNANGKIEIVGQE